jgi:hypothetical protein
MEGKKPFAFVPTANWQTDDLQKRAKRRPIASAAPSKSSSGTRALWDAHCQRKFLLVHDDEAILLQFFHTTIRS